LRTDQIRAKKISAPLEILVILLSSVAGLVLKQAKVLGFEASGIRGRACAAPPTH
jgi:hypothetical protein